MDVLTHAFVPFAAYTWARRPARQRIAAAVGGLSPDLDTIWAWLSHVHEYAYPLVHRGFSHTLIGAPLLATGLYFLLSRPFLKDRWHRFANFTWSPDILTPLWLGSWSHLILDGLTITGTPALWPFDDTRYTTDWFFFGVLFLLPVSLVAWIQILRRKATDRFVKASLVTLAALLLAAGAIRWYSYPNDLRGDEDVTPGPTEWTWIVSYRNETGVLTYATGFGGVKKEEVFLPEPNRTQALEAIHACERDLAYTPWKWYLGGLAVANATRTEDGGWRIHFADSMWYYVEVTDTTPFLRSPSREESDFDEGGDCTVTPDGRAAFVRTRGWLGS